MRKAKLGLGIGLATLCLLFSTGSNSSLRADDKTISPAAIDALTKAIEKLNKNVEALDIKLTGTDTSNNTTNLTLQISKLTSEISDLKKKLKELEEKQPYTSKRIDLANSNKPTGTVRFVNKYFLSTTVVLNGQSYLLSPGDDIAFRVPTGKFTYQVLELQNSIQYRTLNENKESIITISTKKDNDS